MYVQALCDDQAAAWKEVIICATHVYILNRSLSNRAFDLHTSITLFLCFCETSCLPPSLSDAVNITTVLTQTTTAAIQHTSNPQNAVHPHNHSLPLLIPGLLDHPPIQTHQVHPIQTRRSHPSLHRGTQASILRSALSTWLAHR